jgi:hypothetical protein
LALLLLAACSAPQDVFDPAADPVALEQQARARWADPATKGDGARQLAWTCLLRDRGCQDLRKAVPDIRDPDPVTKAFLRALAHDGMAEVRLRAEAWLDVFTVALQDLIPTATRDLIPAATRELTRLARFDRAAVNAAVCARKPVVDAWPAGPLPLVSVRQTGKPLHKRLRTGLHTLAADLPQQLDLALAASQTVTLVPERTDDGPPPCVQGPVATQGPIAATRWRTQAPQPGVYGVRAEFVLAGDQTVRVTVQAPYGARAWLDGAVLPDADASARRATEAQKTVAAGRHTLDLAVGLLSDADTLAIAVLPTIPTATDAPLRHWPAPVAAIAHLWSQGEPAQVPPGLAAFSHSVLPALHRIAVARDADAADRVIDSLPDHTDARIVRAAAVREAGNAQLGRDLLLALGPLPPPPGVERETVPQGSAALAKRDDFLFEHARSLVALGLNDEAAAVLERLGKDCATVDRALDVAGDVLPRPLLARMLQGVDAGCQDTHVARARRRIGQPGADASDAGDKLWSQFQTAAAAGERSAVQRTLQQILTEPGQRLDLRQKALEAGALPPWHSLVRDGMDSARLADDPSLAAATVWLLDQEIDYLLPGGGAIRRVHQVLRVRDHAAAEAVGEVQVADGGTLEFARTILPDGRVVLPAETDDKQTVSLRAVAAGSVVEYAQLVYVPPDDAATGATRLGPFLFQATDGPVQLSEYVVLAPPGVDPVLTRSPSAPVAEVREVAGMRAWIFRQRDLPRFRPEPRGSRPELAMPSVRLATVPGLEPVIGPWHEAALAGLDADHVGLADLLNLARSLPDGALRWRKVAQKLARDVAHAHDGGAPGRPDTALEQQKGDRAAVLHWLARKLGTDACLVRVVPLSRTPPSAPPDAADWTQELVRLRLPRPGNPAETLELWYDPGLEGGLLDHVRAGLRGQPGLLVGCAQPPQDPRVTVPPLGEGRDTRRIEVRLQWLRDGAVAGQATELLDGALAALLRSWLRAGEDAKTHVLQELAGSAFPGLDVAWIGASELDGPGPLTVRYKVTGAAAAGRVAALDLGLYPDALGQTYAALHERRTRLLFSHALDTHLHIEVQTLGEPFSAVPVPLNVAEGPVRATLTAAVAGDRIVIRKTINARPAVVDPGAYLPLAAALRALDAAESVRLQRTAKPIDAPAAAR